jgi:hypothetical protein
MTLSCHNNGCFACGSAVGNFAIYIDDMSDNHSRVFKSVTVENGNYYSESSGPLVFTLNPGNHHLKARFYRVSGGADVELQPNNNNDGTRMTLMIIPQ